MKIGDKYIGGKDLIIVVEAGTTCNGSVDEAKRMADASKDSGADAIKYQAIGPDDLMSDKTVQYTYQWAKGTKTENMYEMFQGLTFTPQEWAEIAKHCDSIELPWYMTVDYPRGVDMAEEIGCPMYKISSWDARNFPLIHRMAKTGKPIQIDLGPHLEGEIVTMLHEIGGNPGPGQKVVLVHATHATIYEEYNMRAIPYLKHRFELPVGWSADSRDHIPDIMAVGLGACLIEKRLTMKWTYEGHHHFKALEPHEFKAWVGMMRRAHRMLGEYDIKPSLEDIRQKEHYFTSLVALENIKAGDIIEDRHLGAKRPGKGVSPIYTDKFVGKVATCNIAKDEAIRWDHV